MEKHVKLLCLIAGVFLVCSCVSQPVHSPETRYEKDAIRLKLRSDPKLNLNEGLPHTLLVTAASGFGDFIHQAQCQQRLNQANGSKDN